jgi:hypothetical protein
MVTWLSVRSDVTELRMILSKVTMDQRESNCGINVKKYMSRNTTRGPLWPME